MEDDVPDWLGRCGFERLEDEFAAIKRDVIEGRLPGVTKASGWATCGRCLLGHA